MLVNHSARRFILTVSLLFPSGLLLLAVAGLNTTPNTSAQTTTPQTKSGRVSQSALVREYLEGMQRLRGTQLTPAARNQLELEMAQKRQQLKDLRKQTRLARGVLPFGPPPTEESNVKKQVGTPSDADAKQKAQSVESCSACKFIVNQVAMDVGSARLVADVQAAFEQNCMNAQKSTIYYGACEDIYDDLYAMTDDYTTNTFTVDQICQRAKLCQ